VKKMLNKLISYNKLYLLPPTIIGISVWIVFYWINNLTDPQSYDNYWQIGYPIFIGSAFFISIISETHPFMFGLVIGSVQILLGLFILKGDLTQLPIGLIFHLIILIPIVICGYFGSWLRNFLRKKKGSSEKEKGHNNDSLILRPGGSKRRS
jgi:hypothetical protein